MTKDQNKQKQKTRIGSSLDYLFTVLDLINFFNRSKKKTSAKIKMNKTNLLYTYI